MFESWRACKRLVNKKTYSKHFDYSSIFWIANINNSLLLNWEVGQWASLLHLGCRGCEFESRPPNTFMVKLYKNTYSKT